MLVSTSKGNGATLPSQEQGASRLEILLTHHDHGPVWVSIWDEATWWMRKRQWTITGDEELGTFEDADFEETPAQIDAALATASAPYVDDTDRDSVVRCDPRAFRRW